MMYACPHCSPEKDVSERRTKIHRIGHYRRKSDSKYVQRFRCTSCSKCFSTATFHPCFRQHKRRFNFKVFQFLASGVSQRRSAKLLNLNRKTVVRKFLFEGHRCLEKLKASNKELSKQNVVVFDDLETTEHTKCKPLSVTLMVTEKRRILDFEVAKMPAKGKLARIAFKKYGPRKDERPQARRKLFERMQPLIAETAVIKSDENPHYISDVKKYFPKAEHKRFKGQRGSIVGQGELKKIRFDPIFSLNHTYAMLRANMNRLFRRTWCTTKIPERLRLHIAIYSIYHNFYLLDGS